MLPEAAQRTGDTCSSVEEMLAAVAVDACQACSSLSECMLGTFGWFPVRCEEETEKMRRQWPDYPLIFRWRKCARLREAEQQKRTKEEIPLRFQCRTWESYRRTAENEKAYRECVEYAASLSRYTQTGLLLFGSPGTGKTHLALCILRDAFQKGLPAAFVPVADMLAEMRKSIETGEPAFLVEKAKSKFLVVLDDLGVEKSTDWAVQELWRLIDSRYKQMLPTVITTNLPAEELRRHISDRNYDRLTEMCKPVFVGGKSYRAEARRNLEIGQELSEKLVPLEWRERK